MWECGYMLFQQIRLYSNSVEMHQDLSSEAKQNRLSEAISATEALKLKQQFNNNVDHDNNSVSKSATKLPPLKKAKVEEMVADRTHETAPPPNLEKRISDPDKKLMQNQNSYIVRKVNSKRKIEKKKPMQEEFKPQTLQRYEQYTLFTSLINISNNLKIVTTQFSKPYVFYVGKGNNGSLIKSIFRQYRPWWVLQDQNPQNSQINLYWYQIRQNNILEKLKQHTSDYELEKLEYFAENVEMEEKQYEENAPSSKNMKSSNQRSQSLVSKDPIFLSKKADLQPEKRSTSKTKGFNKSTDKIIKNSPSIKHHSIRQLKQEVIEPEQGTNMKKGLSNPKMWPVYYMYRRIFSAPDMKNIKKLKQIKEDGSMNGQLVRNKMKTIQNRSSFIKMHNHLQNNWNLSNKKALFVNVRHFFQARKINPFEYIPMTFHVEKIGDKQYDNFVEEYHRRCQQIAQDQKNNKKSQYKTVFKPKKRNAWLVKPGENTNRGVGIEVVESLDEIKQIITKDNIDPMGRPRTHIIQEYIMPFLYQKRKFDIRCYILLTSVNGIQKGYWYQDGYIRTACKEFNMKNLSNRMIHLTNDAVQKHCQDYGKFEPGNKLSFADFQRYLDNNYNNIQNGPKFKFWQQAYPEMKKLATDAIRSVYTKIDPRKKQFSFEIFGLDFLIDENFKVWLIEANTNPCLELSAPLLGRIIPSMLENAFKIALDPVFPPPSLSDLSKLSKKIYVPENAIQNNKFQLVFDQIEQGAELKALATNSPDMPIFNIEQEQQSQFDSDKQNCLDD